MKAFPSSDLARHALSKTAITRVRSDITRLSQEMASGLRADPVRQARGDAALIAGLDRALATGAAALERVRLVQMRLDAQTDVLTSLTTAMDGNANTLLRSDMIATDDRLTPVAKQVRDTFETAIGLLNTQFAGRALFAGSHVDQSAIASPEAVLAALSSAVPSGARASEITAIVTDWFAPGGPIDAFLPPDTPLDAGRIAIDDGTTVTTSLTAGAPALRDALAALATGALMHERAEDFAPETRRQVLGGLAIDLRKSVAGILQNVELIGADLARSDRVMTRIAAQQAQTEQALNDIRSVDPYETATVLQDRIARLDQIFAITARLSRLSLSNFL